MAQQTVVTLMDDLDPEGKKVADETVYFGLDGMAYEIDLAAANAARLRKAMADYVGAARTVKAPTGRAPKGSKGRDRDTARAQREWAKAQGIVINDRGRVPVEVVAKWKAATGG